MGNENPGTPPPTEKIVMAGGPADEIPPTPTKKEDPKPTEPIYKGLKEVTTVDDLKEYTAELEQRMAERVNPPAIPPKPTPTVGELQPKAPTVTVNADDKFEDLLYNNPTKAKEVIKHEIRQEFTQERRLEKDRAQFWSEFYAENPDLKDLDRIVQSVVRDNQATLNQTPIPQAKTFIAKHAREWVSQVRKNIGVRETEVPGGSSVTLGGGNNAGQGPKNNQPAAPISFIDQFQKFKNKRKKG